MTIDDKKDIQDALNIISKMLDKEIIDDTLIPTNFIHRPSYNKAIDDFKSEVKNLIVDLNVIRFKDIDEIAEQLKAGGDNEN